MTKTVEQLAAEAAALIRKGWCQGYLSTDTEGNVAYPEEGNVANYCAIGAMSEVAPKDDDGIDLYIKLLDEFQAHLGPKEGGMYTIASFNDAPGRTAEEVAAVFDKIAEGK